MEYVEFVNIANFGTSADAHVARNELEAAGIPAQVTGDVAVEALWYVGTALGGVKLMVAEKDVPAALTVLTELGILDADHEIPVDDADAEHDKAPQAEKESAQAEEWESLANRAWRAAVIGLFLCPPILHGYSFSLIIFNQGVFQGIEPQHKWKLWGALAIDLTVFGVVAALAWSIANAS